MTVRVGRTAMLENLYAVAGFTLRVWLTEQLATVVDCIVSSWLSITAMAPPPVIHAASPESVTTCNEQAVEVKGQRNG